MKGFAQNASILFLKIWTQRAVITGKYQTEVHTWKTENSVEKKLLNSEFQTMFEKRRRKKFHTITEKYSQRVSANQSAVFHQK